MLAEFCDERPVRLTEVGTEAESADDWIARRAAQLDEPFVLVTSDRELRQRAGNRAERIVGGGSFARELQAAAPEAPSP